MKVNNKGGFYKWSQDCQTHVSALMITLYTGNDQHQRAYMTYVVSMFYLMKRRKGESGMFVITVRSRGGAATTTGA